ncbi:MAG TPA: protein kinase, partial [Holophagaceae bacterium]
YMSPEQIRGDRVDARTDLYALGIMLFELCSGIAPFDSPRIEELLGMHLETPAPLLQAVMPDLPRDLGVLVARMLEKHPGSRPQSAAEVSEILKLLASGEGGASRI